MRRVIVGTAGHIDHGKTRLVEALTGIDCDRWEEEKRRGITIDIGFAHSVEEDLQIGFVDVPGHEKFLHNALAGLGGIRLVLLVVAADEGVEPQTREHLAVCDLLEIPAAVVALTKRDLVPEERIEAVRARVEGLLAETRFAGAPTYAVSSVTGEGVAELRDALRRHGEENAQPASTDRPARLPVDRAFLIKGRGLVATGTLASGAIQPGDELAVVPDGGTARVRGIQVHGTDRARAEAGERVALQLAGVEAAAVPRGVQLITPGGVSSTRRWLARCRLLPEAPKAIAATVGVRVHLYSAEVLGKLRPLSGAIEPGEEGLVEIRLAHAVGAVRDDRFIVRRPSPAMTIGGGRVLDPLWYRHRGRRLRAALETLPGDVEEAVRFWVEDAGSGGLALAPLAARLGWGRDSAGQLLSRLREAQRVVRLDGSGEDARWLAPGVLERVEKRARRTLERYFADHRTQTGMPRAEAVAAILPGRGAELTPAHLHWLERRGVLEVRGDKVGLPGRGAELTSGESKLARRILAAYEAAGLTPPPPSEVRAALGAKAQILDGVLTHLLEQGKLVRLPGGLLIAGAAVEGMTRDLRREGMERFGVGDFKKRFGLTRKWAIPLLEHLDSIGVTRRVGDERQLIRR